MKLVIAVINRDDTYPLTDVLMRQDYQATIVGSTGGFLREGNTTLLIGGEKERLGHLLQLIKDNCRTRTKSVIPFSPVAEYGEALSLYPIEVQVGGAIVFVLDVERFERF